MHPSAPSSSVGRAHLPPAVHPDVNTGDVGTPFPPRPVQQQQLPRQQSLRQQLHHLQEQQHRGAPEASPFLKRSSSYNTQSLQNEQEQRQSAQTPNAGPGSCWTSLSNSIEGDKDSALRGRRPIMSAMPVRRSASDLPPSMLHASEAAQVYVAPLTTAAIASGFTTPTAPYKSSVIMGGPPGQGKSSAFAAVSATVAPATPAAATLGGPSLPSTAHIAPSSSVSYSGELSSAGGPDPPLNRLVFSRAGTDSESCLAHAGGLGSSMHQHQLNEHERKPYQKKTQQTAWMELYGEDIGGARRAQAKELRRQKREDLSSHLHRDFTGDGVDFLASHLQVPCEQQEINFGDYAESCDTFKAAKLKDGLFIGDELAASNADFLIINKVTHIVNCSGLQTPDVFAGTDIKVKYLTFSWPERGAAIFDREDKPIKQIYNFIEESAKQGESCLVHSQKGQSRACVALVAYLMLKYSWSLMKAREFLSHRHQEVKIAPEYDLQLQQFEQRLIHEKGRALSKDWTCFPPSVTGKDQGEADLSDEYLVTNTFLNSLTSTQPTVTSVFFGCADVIATGRSHNAGWPGALKEKPSRRRLRWVGEETLSVPATRKTAAEEPPSSNNSSSAKKELLSILKATRVNQKKWKTQYLPSL